jgi:type I restriction enzyme S subunit
MGVVLPTTSAEQRAIAEALSDVDGLLGGLDRLIAKKRDLKQAAMQQLLTGQTRLPGFGGAWEEKTLGDTVETIVGGGTPSRANSAFWGNEIPWITVKDFATFNPRQSEESITRLGLRNSATHLIPAGTLITSTRMALGKAVVYEVDVAINQDLKALFLKSDTSVLFLTYWFEYFGGMIEELGSGSTVKGISLIELRRFAFQAPQLPEQVAIAAVLADMDAELSALEARRGKTRDLKQAMMQELLTGKTRLVPAAGAHV